MSFAEADLVGDLIDTDEAGESGSSAHVGDDTCVCACLGKLAVCALRNCRTNSS